MTNKEVIIGHTYRGKHNLVRTVIYISHDGTRVRYSDNTSPVLRESTIPIEFFIDWAHTDITEEAVRQYG